MLGETVGCRIVFDQKHLQHKDRFTLEPELLCDIGVLSYNLALRFGAATFAALGSKPYQVLVEPSQQRAACFECCIVSSPVGGVILRWGWLGHLLPEVLAQNARLKQPPSGFVQQSPFYPINFGSIFFKSSNTE